MQCQICNNNEATIHLTEIVDSMRSEMHLCENCATEQGIAVKSHMPINELLGNLLSSAPAEEQTPDSADKQVACPYCGITLDQFRKEAALGCPHDYEVFEKSLSKLIEKAHDGQSIHRGKVPSKAPKDTKITGDLLKMQQQLDAAIKAENYELAAKLRDQINKKIKTKKKA